MTGIAPFSAIDINRLLLLAVDNAMTFCSLSELLNSRDNKQHYRYRCNFIENDRQSESSHNPQRLMQWIHLFDRLLLYFRSHATKNLQLSNVLRGFKRCYRS